MCCSLARFARSRLRRFFFFVFFSCRLCCSHLHFQLFQCYLLLCNATCMSDRSLARAQGKSAQVNSLSLSLSLPTISWFREPRGFCCYLRRRCCKAAATARRQARCRVYQRPLASSRSGSCRWPAGSPPILLLRWRCNQRGR